MTALASMRSNQPERWTRKQFLLAANNVAWKGGVAVFSAGKIIPAGVATGLVTAGTFAENKKTSVTDQLVDVDLGVEIEVRWYANGGASLAVGDIGALCYWADDQTVVKSPTGASLAGRVWAIDATKGVAVQALRPTA